MPSPLKKIQERLIPDGEICNLRLARAFVADSYEESPPTLGIEAVVMDGEYEGEPVTDYLNIQESTKKETLGDLYISKKGKLHRTLRFSLSTKEFNDLADRLAEAEASREAWLPIIAEALTEADNPVFRSVVAQNEPEDEANKRNKLTKEPNQIAPYMDPDEDAKIRRTSRGLREGQKAASKAKEPASELSAKEKAEMEKALGA